MTMTRIDTWVASVAKEMLPRQAVAMFGGMSPFTRLDKGLVPLFRKAECVVYA